MKFSEFTNNCPHFLLRGGPCDGHKVESKLYDAWPSEIEMVGKSDGDRVTYVYRMRIGDLENYDYSHTIRSERRVTYTED